jgi:hypothetical protein
MRPVSTTDKLTNFICRLSGNLGASTSWNPQGLSKPVEGLLCLYLLTIKLHGVTSQTVVFCSFTVCTRHCSQEFQNMFPSFHHESTYIRLS